MTGGKKVEEDKEEGFKGREGSCEHQLPLCFLLLHQTIILSYAFRRIC